LKVFECQGDFKHQLAKVESCEVDKERPNPINIDAIECNVLQSGCLSCTKTIGFFTNFASYPAAPCIGPPSTVQLEVFNVNQYLHLVCLLQFAKND
jgi:hypothetical protein